MKSALILNTIIVNENKTNKGSVLIKNGLIEEIYPGVNTVPEEIINQSEVIDASGKILIPGIIDDHVHFRQPGLETKGTIYTESIAAIAGGVTSFMEMPNTVPQTINHVRLEEKFALAKENSFANYSFYLGATNENIEEIVKSNPSEICGVKAFLGSSTGNMLLNNKETLANLFRESPLPIAAHCEDETIIKNNLAHYTSLYGHNIPIDYHPKIRSEEACYKSSSSAIELAEKYGSKFHILHLSTEKELNLFNSQINRKDKKITSEACIHHLWFNDKDYNTYGTRIKWNPAIKSEKDRVSLLMGLKENQIDLIGTDHAPHTLKEKSQPYTQAPSGGPMIQHSLQAMLEFYHNNILSLTEIVDKMCHAPADIFNVRKRGYIKKGYYADLVLVELHKSYKVDQNNLLYKCKWSPMENYTFKSSITHTFVNGILVFENGKINNIKAAQKLEFDR
ncbi:MAG: dihydroorotase [Bacteroidales bacterium]